jgi:hypothetical protein
MQSGMHVRTLSDDRGVVVQGRAAWSRGSTAPKILSLPPSDTHTDTAHPRQGAAIRLFDFGQRDAKASKLILNSSEPTLSRLVAAASRLELEAFSNQPAQRTHDLLPNLAPLEPCSSSCVWRLYHTFANRA